MKIVSDSSPLHYLILIGKVDLLRVLFGTIVIPRCVQEELECPGAPPAVREWFSAMPTWACVCAVVAAYPSLPLGKGESEAIYLATELHADAVLLDDKKARRIAQEHGLAVAGTLAILRAAHDRGLVQLPEVIRDLRQCGFRMSEKLARQVSAELTGNLGETTS